MSDRSFTEKSKSNLGSQAKILIYIALLTGAVTTAFLTSNFASSYIKSSLNSSRKFTYPTSIPWISDQTECERTNRNWRDRKCWDYEHNSSF